MIAEPKTLVVLLDESAHARARLNYALDIACEYGAHVVGVFIDALPHAVSAESSSFTFARGRGVSDAIDAYFAEQEKAAEYLQHTMQSRAREYGASTEWRHLATHAKLRDVVTHCTCSDLLILPPPTRSSESQPWTSADVVFASGIPGIIVPYDVSPPPIRRALVAWNASREARRAVGDALPFLKRAECVTVVMIDASGGVRGHAEEPGADVARFLTRHGVAVSVEQITSADGHVADELSRCAERLGVELVVAGAYGHSRIIEVVLGSTTRRILSEFKVPVFMSH